MINKFRAGMAYTLPAAALFIALAAGCGGSGDNGGSSTGSTTVTTTTGGPARVSHGGAAGAATGGAASGQKYVFAIIPKSTNNPVFTIAEKGAEQEAATLGDSTVEYKGSETGQPSQQARIIEDMVQKKVSGMSISVIDANAVQGPINDAMAAGIPVMCFDSDAPGSKRFAYYSVSDEEVGKQLANLLTTAVGGPKNMKGEVAILSGQPSAPNLQGRVKGATEVLTAIPGVTILPTLFCNDSIPKSIEDIRDTMAAHPKLRGWVLVGGWPLFADSALDSITDHNRTKVVSVDALPKEWDYLKSGQVYALLGQKLFGWGQVSVQTLHDYVTGKNKNPGTFINSGYDLIFLKPDAQQQSLSKGNVKVWSLDDYTKQWAQWNGGGKS
ncbi:MAG: sugar-binding protein [Chloroflexi bacterium]|nr:sugar-binding protein [Chloroflexota bacterium]